MVPLQQLLTAANRTKYYTDARKLDEIYRYVTSVSRMCTSSGHWARWALPVVVLYDCAHGQNGFLVLIGLVGVDVVKRLRVARVAIRRREIYTHLLNAPPKTTCAKQAVFTITALIAHSCWGQWIVGYQPSAAAVTVTSAHAVHYLILSIWSDWSSCQKCRLRFR